MRIGAVDYSRGMKVIHTVQSITGFDDPVDITYARDTDAIGVISCVAQILDTLNNDRPWVKTLSIRIEM